jgi:hypothetical protein
MCDKHLAMEETGNNEAIAAREEDLATFMDMTDAERWEAVFDFMRQWNA